MWSTIVTAWLLVSQVAAPPSSSQDVEGVFIYTGWKENPADGTLTYIVHIPSEQVGKLAEGKKLEVAIPEEVRPRVGHVSILISNQPAERQPPAEALKVEYDNWKRQQSEPKLSMAFDDGSRTGGYKTIDQSTTGSQDSAIRPTQFASPPAGSNGQVATGNPALGGTAASSPYGYNPQPTYSNGQSVPVNQNPPLASPSPPPAAVQPNALPQTPRTATDPPSLYGQPNYPTTQAGTNPMRSTMELNSINPAAQGYTNTQQPYPFTSQQTNSLPSTAPQPGGYGYRDGFPNGYQQVASNAPLTGRNDYPPAREYADDYDRRRDGYRYTDEDLAKREAEIKKKAEEDYLQKRQLDQQTALTAYQSQMKTELEKRSAEIEKELSTANTFVTFLLVFSLAANCYLALMLHRLFQRFRNLQVNARNQLRTA